MPSKKFNFSLGSLMLAALSLSAMLGGILTLNRNAELYYRQREMTNNQLFDIGWQIRSYMDQTQSEFYPSTIDELASKKALNVPQRFFTNPRLAELNEGFYTIAGIKRQDMGCIWLYENLPPECRDGRFVLAVQGEALVPVWMLEEQFQDELKRTLKRPNTKAIANDRTKSSFGWPIPGAKVESDRIEMTAASASKEIYFFNIRQGMASTAVVFFGMAVVLALALFVHHRLRQ